MEYLKKFRNWKDTEEYPAASVIFPEGNPADHLYVILSGEVELSLRGNALDVEKPGGLIGEMALFESASRSSTATALTDVKLARLDRNQLAGLMNENTEFSLQLMSVLANRLRAINEYIATSLGPA
jgi:CRP/FNR family cyclic AMP-dependent transcriptional regulator